MTSNRVKPEDWIEFNEVMDEEQGLVTSLREAERMLRKLCASGAIQTLRFNQEGAEIVPEFIAPNEWKRADFDTTLVYRGRGLAICTAGRRIKVVG
jgi:hypothetical protein